MKNITICICTYNNYDVLYKSINSLVKQSVTQSEYDVLILDNTPSLFTNKHKQAFAKCMILCKKNNFKYVRKITSGLSEARNACIELTDTSIIHFIDDDALVHHDFVESTLKCFNENENLVVLGGKVIADWSMTKKPEWLSNNMLGFLSMLDFGNDIKKRESKGFWLVGANIAFRKNIFNEIGYFDEDLGRKGNSNTLMGQEENEIINRIPSKYDVIYHPSIKIDHIVPPEKATQAWFLKRVSWQAVSDVTTNDLWLTRKPRTKQHIKENLHKILDETNTEKDFADKLETIQYLVFHLLYTGDLKDDNITQT
jgi:glucosyl-dolichyl phosphate glucuronosyltransferase